MMLNSPAKLNLYLKVLNQRKDGYHNIETLFERINLCDKIILKKRPDKKINIISSSPDIPKDKTNLCYRGAKLLQDEFSVNQGVEIKIIKNIPVGSGLGGGSSNAAAVLMGLNKLWRLNLRQDKLVNLAKKIGADVPFFLYQASFARGKCRGDNIKPLGGLINRRLWHILVVPKINVSTASIYRKWDALKRKLTIAKSGVKILNSGLRKKDFSLLAQGLFNGLEEASMQLYPQIKRIKEKLSSLGVKAILMSGSGPAVFGIVSCRKEAQALERQLRAENSTWQIFLVRTV